MRGRRHGLAAVGVAVVLSVAAAAAPGDPFPPPDVEDIAVGTLAPGQARRIAWGSIPVWVVARGGADLARLDAAGRGALGAPHGEQWQSSLVFAGTLHQKFPALLALDQPLLERSRYRSRIPGVLVVIGFSPYDGCDIDYLPPARRGEAVDGVVAAFANPCGGERYDLSGRVLRGHRFGAEWNLYIPPHQFDEGGRLTIGLGDPPRDLPAIDTRLRVDFRPLPPPRRLLEAARRGGRRV